MNNRPWQQYHFAAGSPNPAHGTTTINSAGSAGDLGREGPPLISAEAIDGQLDHDPRLDRGNPGVILEAAAGVDSLQLYLQVQNIDSRLSSLETHVYNNLQPRLQEALAETAAVTGEPTRGDLDRACLPLLEMTPYPTNTQQNECCRQLEQAYPRSDRRIILSEVRRWFRKRREEMTSRIMTACRNLILLEGLIPNLSQPPSAQEIETTIGTILNNTALMDQIREEANLEVVQEQCAREFCMEKVMAYIRRTVQRNAESAEAIPPTGDEE